MNEIRISIVDDTSPEVAMQLVFQVMQEGRISTGKNGKPCYCLASEYSYNGVKYIIITSDNAKNDCFRVWKENIL